MANKTSFCINYLFDGTDVLYVLQFVRGDNGRQDLNRFVGCVKNVIAGLRQEAEGDLDKEELDKAPVLLFKTNLDSNNSDVEVLTSMKTPEALKNRCTNLAEAGPREILSRVMTLYISKIKVIENEPRYSGVVMKFEDNQAAVYQGEPRVAREIEMLVSMFFPEMNPKK